MRLCPFRRVMGDQGHSYLTMHCWRRLPQNHQDGFLMLAKSLTDRLSVTLLIFISRKENMTAINITWQMERKSRETAGCADSSDAGGQQSWDQNSVWPEWNSSGGHSLRFKWVTPPFAALSKTTMSTCKKHMLFQFLVNINHQRRQ